MRCPTLPVSTHSGKAKALKGALTRANGHSRAARGPAVRRQSLGEVEKHSASQRLADGRPNPEDQCQDTEVGRRLAHFQAQLTPTLRRAFQLRDVDGLSIHQTAQILGVPHGTVKAQLARARKRLRNLMRRALRFRAAPRTHRATRSGLRLSRRGRQINSADCSIEPDLSAHRTEVASPRDESPRLGRQPAHDSLATCTARFVIAWLRSFWSFASN